MRGLRRNDLPAVTAANLSRRFGLIEAVRGVSFEVARGEVFALLGPNGAGKSTILRMLSSLVPPTGGHATVAGYDVVERPRAVQRRARLVYPGQPLMRARFHLPDVLLVDEPGDALSVEAARLRAEGVTIVYSAGTPQEAEQADRVAIVDQGVIVALDTPAGVAAAVGRPTLGDAFVQLTGQSIDLGGGDELGAARRFMAAHRR